MTHDIKDLTNKAVICIHETNGRAQLYGSKVNHYNYMTLYIRRAENGDTMDPFDRVKPHSDSLIEVNMSLTQFAEMICSVGKGNGTPCTLRTFMGTRLPKYELPDQKKSLLDYADSLSKRTTEKLKSAKELIKSKLQSGKKLTNAEMHDVISAIESYESDPSNIKFISDCTAEVFEKAVSEAKTSLENEFSKLQKIGSNPPSSPLLEYKDE